MHRGSQLSEKVDIVVENFKPRPPAPDKETKPKPEKPQYTWPDPKKVIEDRKARKL